MVILSANDIFHDKDVAFVIHSVNQQLYNFYIHPKGNQKGPATVRFPIGLKSMQLKQVLMRFRRQGWGIKTDPCSNGRFVGQFSRKPKGG